MAHSTTMKTRTLFLLAAVATLAGLARPCLAASPTPDAAAPARPANAAEPAAKRWRAWQKPPDAELRRRLTPPQYMVTQQAATEPPFQNEYWRNHEDGIYVDVVSGEPLFSSLDKFESGTGWPSFTRPLEPANVVEKDDTAFFVKRTEVRSKHADSHLGHVFDDGPPPTRQRYCLNSAALRFVPAAKLAEEGYGEYASLFPSAKPAAASAETRAR